MNYSILQNAFNFQETVISILHSFPCKNIRQNTGFSTIKISDCTRNWASYIFIINVFKPSSKLAAAKPVCLHYLCSPDRWSVIFPCLTYLIVPWFSFLFQEGLWDVEEYACSMKYIKNGSCVLPWRWPAHPCMVITVVVSVIGKAQAGCTHSESSSFFPWGL